VQLTLTGEYAIRAMIYIVSVEENANCKISEISSLNKIPEKFLRKIIPQLANAGLIKSQRGSGGGIKLGRSSDKITPLDIVLAVEGQLALNKCLIDKKFCSNERWCTVHTLWCDAQKSLKLILSSKSIAQLAKESKEKKKMLNHSLLSYK
jgi:Rrf2 family protein